MIKKRSRELSTQKLIRAGLEVFSKYGFEAATTQQISKRAGVNAALIARYFKSKSGLLNAIIVEFARMAQEKTSEYPAGKTLEEEITNYIEAHLEIYDQYRDFTRIAISRLLIDAKLNKDLAKYLSLETDDLLVRRLKGFQERGEIAPDRDILMAANMIVLEAKGIFLMSSIMSDYCERFDGTTCHQLAFNLAYGLQTPLPARS
jgi:AcrR family transcriptional regulator